MACFNQVFSNFSEAFGDYSNDIRRAINLNQTDLLPGTCCSWFKFEKKLLRISKACPEENSKYLMTFIRRFSSDLVDLLCSQIGSYESETCQNLVIPNELKEMEKTSSFIPPLLVLLEKL